MQSSRTELIQCNKPAVLNYHVKPNHHVSICHIQCTCLPERPNMIHTQFFLTRQNAPICFKVYSRELTGHRLCDQAVMMEDTIKQRQQFNVMCCMYTLCNRHVRVFMFVAV